VSDAPWDPPVTAPGPLIGVVNSDDPRLDLYRELNDPARRTQLETDEGVFVVEGKLAVDRLLTSGYTVRSLLVDDHQVMAASDLVAATRDRGVPVLVGSRAVVAETVGFPFHRGVVAVANRPAPLDPGLLLTNAALAPTPNVRPLVAVLEGLNDHENIGALFRNAAAFGVAGVLLDPTSADPLYRRSIRVSVGYVLHTPFARLAPWPSGLEQVRAAGFMVAAFTPRRADGAIPAVSLSGLRARLAGPRRPAGVALLLGAEGPGLTELALAASDLVVRIPMANGVDSLNVATAAALAFHALAQD
jgi:tRNA G18 (ribose-2'-O)-methylase SpoU